MENENQNTEPQTEQAEQAEQMARDVVDDIHQDSTAVEDDQRGDYDRLSSEPESGRKYSRCVVDNHDTILKRISMCESISDVSQSIGISRATLTRYVHDCPDLDRAYKDAQEKKLDLMEKVVLNIATIDSENVETVNGFFPRNDGRIMNANLNAAKFYLERQGAKRGWGAKIETNEVGNGVGVRMPMIFLGDVSEETIAQAEADIAAANAEASKDPS